jgi:uncharacterized protein (TIGR00251 family)
MLFSVKIVPGSKKNIVTSLTPTRLEVRVKEEAKDNRANEQAILLIADHFKVVSSKVRIVRGHHRPQKIVLIDEEV